VLRTAIEAHDGFLFSHTGDGVVAAFASPKSAVDAALAAQRALELPVRMGIATGDAELRDGDYFGRQVKEARTAAEQRKRAATQAAEKRTAAAKQQADDVAQRKNSAEAAKREEQAKITAAEQTATAAAESKLKDAQATRSDAASKRAQADQIEQLADVEKQKRQSEPSNDA